MNASQAMKSLLDVIGAEELVRLRPDSFNFAEW